MLPHPEYSNLVDDYIKASPKKREVRFRAGIKYSPRKGNILYDDYREVVRRQ
jgi:hypothetical protein